MPPLFLSLPGSVAIAVPPRLRCMTTYVLLEQEDWFEDDLRFLRRIVWPGMRMVDVGANFGVYSLSLAPLIGPTGGILAIEPAADTCDLLCQSIARNRFDHVTALRAALSDHNGTGFLAHGFSPESAHLETTALAQQGEQVPLYTLDTVLAEKGWDHVDFIKIDAEGHEPAVIAGGQHVLSQQAPALMPALMIEVMGSDAVSLRAADMLRGLGYGLYLLLPGLMFLVPFDAIVPEEYPVLNLYALKPAKAAEWAAAGWLAPAQDFCDLQDAGPDKVAAHWAAARDPGLAPATRWGHLIQAQLYHHDQGERPHDPEWLYRAACLADDAGQRGVAFRYVQDALAQAQPEIAAPDKVAIIRLLDRLACWTSLLQPGPALERNRMLRACDDQSLDTIRRGLLLSVLTDQTIPLTSPWSNDSRLLCAHSSPHAHIWAGQHMLDISS